MCGFNVVARQHQQSEYDLLPMDRVTDISVRRLDQQIIEKKNPKYISSDNQPQTEKYVKRRVCSYFHIGLEKTICL